MMSHSDTHYTLAELHELTLSAYAQMRKHAPGSPRAEYWRVVARGYLNRWNAARETAELLLC